MVATTVYNIPEGASNDYAIRQQAYDTLSAEGMVGPIEASAAQAASVSQMLQKLPAWSVMFGLHLKTTIAQFEPPPGLANYRSYSSLEAPTLGPQKKRAADREKVMDAIGALGPTAAPGDEQAGKRIAAVIKQTEDDNKEILFARGQMGSVLAG